MTEQMRALNGQSNECPQSNGLSGYCLGFGSGWNKVSYAQNTLKNANNNNDDNDNSNSGTSENDGKRHIEKSS